MARKPKAPLAAWIVTQRKASGLKPADLAARLGVAETTIRGWETGRGISPENVASLERLFGVAAPDAPQPADMTALVGALSDLVVELRADRTSRAGGVPEPRTPSEVDAATVRERRRYWMARALEESKTSRPHLRAAVGLPAGRERTLSRWLAGELPSGAELDRLAQALMLPLHVLQSPPATDHERLVEWRREAISELPAAEVEPAERKRRSA